MLKQDERIGTSIPEVLNEAATSEAPLADIQSVWSEYVLPLLFIALEACWIDTLLIGLANLNILGSNQPFIPLWIPFVLIASFYLLSHYLYRPLAGTTTSESQRYLKGPAGALLLALNIFATLFVTWLSCFSAHVPLFDLSWLFNLPYDVLQLNVLSFQIVGVIACANLLCRHGDFLVHNRISPVQVRKMSRFGLIIIAVVLLVWSLLDILHRPFTDAPILLTCVVLFFPCALAAHALARVVATRRTHMFSLQEVSTRPERITLQTSVLTISLLALGSLLLAGLVNVLLFPLLRAWLLALLHPGLPYKAPALPPPSHTAHPLPGNPPDVHPSWPYAHATTGPLQGILYSLTFVAFVLLLVVAIALVIWLLRRRAKRKKRTTQDSVESLWSWGLFWKQVRHLCSLLVSRYWPFHHKGNGEDTSESWEQSAQAHTVRAIYQALLQRAARAGYPRVSYETPAEFNSRLSTELPLIQPHMGTITEAYNIVRYSDAAPDEAELAPISQAWSELEQQWQPCHNSGDERGKRDHK